MRLNVYFNAYGQRRLAGALDSQGHEIRFQYHPDFVQLGIPLSPFKLPLNTDVQQDRERTFDGLFGLFNDSLPDGWGLLLLDRAINQRGIRAENLPMLRLSMAGCSAMGALEYEPDQGFPTDLGNLDLDSLAADSLQVLQDQMLPAARLDALLKLNGSSAGARPKILINVNAQHIPVADNTGDPWLIKFRTHRDPLDAGLEEYVYSLAARDAGLDMPETWLFPSLETPGYFGVKRFDRVGGHKVHVHTACGLLHASHRYPSLTYEDLLRLTQILTRDMREVEKMARLMVFNVKAGNKDDHSKNFSFLLTENNAWRMAPAYDLTPSSGINDEHACMVNGKGQNIDDDDLIQAVSVVDLPARRVQEMIEQVEDALMHMEGHRLALVEEQNDAGPHPGM